MGGFRYCYYLKKEKTDTSFHKAMRSVFVIFLVSILYIGTVFLVVKGKTFRWDSDYDSNLPIIAYVVDTIKNEHRFPLWNPYIGRSGIDRKSVV